MKIVLADKRGLVRAKKEEPDEVHAPARVELHGRAPFFLLSSRLNRALPRRLYLALMLEICICAMQKVQCRQLSPLQRQQK